MIEMAIIEKDGRTYMRSVHEQTAEQLVEEINLLRDLNIPLFF